MAWTDGYVGDDGGGWAFRVEGEDFDVAESGSLGRVPSHLAEWIAMESLLRWCGEHLAVGDEVEIRTDSALVAKGLASRRPAMSGEAADLRAASRKLLARLGAAGVRARVVRVPREANARADELARRAASGEPPR